MILEDVVNYLKWISSEGRSFGGLLDIEDIEDCLCWTSLVVLLIILCKVGKFLWNRSYLYNLFFNLFSNAHKINLTFTWIDSSAVCSVSPLLQSSTKLTFLFCCILQRYNFDILKNFLLSSKSRLIPQIHMITENSFVSCKCHHETFVTTHHTRQKVRWW